MKTVVSGFQYNPGNNSTERNRIGFTQFRTNIQIFMQLFISIIKNGKPKSPLIIAGLPTKRNRR